MSSEWQVPRSNPASNATCGDRRLQGCAKHALSCLPTMLPCRLTPTCNGVATLTIGGKRVSTREVPFSVPGDTTSHVPIRLVPRMMGLIRKDDGIATRITAVVGGQTFSQRVSVKIL